MQTKKTPPEADQIRGQVRERYADIARSGGHCCSAESCGCGSELLNRPAAAIRIGYSEAELAAAPAESNLGLGCGNPQAIAELKPGEIVLDLGSGAGFDCFLAARQVGPSGRVIGVDMTPEMVSKARANARADECANVEFRLGEIEHLPVADSSVDVIISNCVINLSPDKGQVLAEAFRVLKPGGRLAISDIVAVKPIPTEMQTCLDAYCGCIAGALPAAKIESLLLVIGFSEAAVVVNPASREFIKDWFPGSQAEEYVRSAAISAVKPAAVRPAEN